MPRYGIASAGVDAARSRDERRGKNIGMVSRARGVGAAGAGESEHCGGSAAGEYEGNPEPTNQAPGDFSSVCAVDFGGGDGRVVCKGAPFAVYDAGVSGAAGKAGADSRADACRRPGALADSYARGQFALSRADFRLS